MQQHYRIRPGTKEEAFWISTQIPEFEEVYPESEYFRRCADKPHLALIAEQAGGELIGYKVGYERENDGSFYSWVGGVRPGWRRRGIATDLAHAMETWAESQGYNSLRMKTQNQFKGMLHLALGEGFDVIGFDPAETTMKHVVWLEKPLNPS